MNTREGADLSSPRLLPRLVIKRDRILPLILGASLLLHVLVLAPILLRDDAKPKGPQEIPVELVQLPPEPPKPPPAQSQKPPKPAAKAETPPQAAPKPKQPAPKPPEPKKAEAKPPEPKKAEVKPPELKKAEAKPPDAKKEQPKKAEAKQPESTAERMRDLLGPQSLDPVAMPGDTADGGDLVSYGQIVMSRLTKALHRDLHPGTAAYATVSFLLGDAGEIVRESLTKPSGDPLLDSEALDVVKRAGPYPPPPPGGKREYTITLESRPIL